MTTATKKRTKKAHAGPPKLILPDKIQKAKDEKQIAKMMPMPAGYQLLILVPPGADQSEGGVWKPDQLIAQEVTACVYGLVHEIGPLAYKDPVRFPDGKPWCKKGDFVVFQPFAGIRMDVAGQELRLLNDDAVLATVEDPRGIKRK